MLAASDYCKWERMCYNLDLISEASRYCRIQISRFSRKATFLSASIFPGEMDHQPHPRHSDDRQHQDRPREVLLPFHIDPFRRAILSAEFIHVRANTIRDYNNRTTL